MGRHFVGDVTAGVLVGYLNFYLVRHILWVDAGHVMAWRAEALALVAMATEKARVAMGTEEKVVVTEKPVGEGEGAKQEL